MSPDDLMSLVGDRRAAPMQVGAVLVLGDGPVDPVAVRAALEQRLSAVPRLRRRLQRVPFGCGRPVWVDDPGFDVGRHFAVRAAGRTLSRQDLLDLAAELVGRPLPAGRPLWAVTLVPDVGSGQAALVVVLHHVLADGRAGLGLLAALLNPVPAAPDPGFPRAGPTTGALRLDALCGRLRGVRRLPATLRRLASAAAEIVPTLRSTAAPSSLNRPTGPTRCLRTVATPLAPLVDLAHRHGATVNDVLLTVVAGALGVLMAGRGEHLECLVLSVPFAVPPPPGSAELGNHSGVVPVRLPTAGPFAARLANAAASTRAAKQHRRGASTALLAPAFRLLDRLGLYQRFIDHQNAIHTVVSNLRGPEQGVSLLGHPVLELVPLSVSSGNLTVAFTALSYRGSLVLTVNADPLTCPDVDRLREALAAQLASLDGRADVQAA